MDLGERLANRARRDADGTLESGALTFLVACGGSLLVLRLVTPASFPFWSHPSIRHLDGELSPPGSDFLLLSCNHRLYLLFLGSLYFSISLLLPTPLVAMPRICIYVRVNLFQVTGFLDGRQQQARTVGQPPNGWLAAQTCAGIEQPDADSR